MSSGSFSRGFYEANSGLLHPIKVQPETTAALFGSTPNLFADDSGAGVEKSKISAKVSKGKREIGLGARTVSISYGTADGQYPADYKPGTTLTIPVFRESVWDALATGGAATYLGVVGSISGLGTESAR